MRLSVGIERELLVERLHELRDGDVELARNEVVRSVGAIDPYRIPRRLLRRATYDAERIAVSLLPPPRARASGT